MNTVVKILQITTVAIMTGSRELTSFGPGLGLGGFVLPGLVAMTIIVDSTR